MKNFCCAEEIAIYEMMFSYSINDILKLSPEKPIIAEGAGFMPSLVKRLNVDKAHYICIVPTREFQIKKYGERYDTILHSETRRYFEINQEKMIDETIAGGKHERFRNIVNEIYGRFK